MKKHLFTAVLALVAVGGAYAQGPYFRPDSDQATVICSAGPGDCSIQYGINTAYTVGGTLEEQEGHEVDLTVLPFAF